ncbi:phage holin family protein [Candidatus Solincola sp.]|nr:phage holin family protein [Actinomycetota bacterium]
MKEIVQKAKKGRKIVADFLQQAKEQKEVLASAVKESLAKSSLSLGLAVFGLVTISLAGVVFVVLLILLVDLFFQRLWLSTMAVMIGMIFTGGVSTAVGVSRLKKIKEIASQDLKNYLSRDPRGRMLGEKVEEVREVALEIVEALQTRREEQKRRIEELWIKAKENAPLILLGLVLLRTLKKRNGN